MAKKTVTPEGDNETPKMTPAQKRKAAAEAAKAQENKLADEEPEMAEVIEEEEDELKAETISQKSISKFNVTDAGLADLRKKYAGISITDLNDKKQVAIVKEAKSDVRQKITDLEKKRVELKAPFLEVGKAIDAHAKKIGLELEEIYKPIGELYDSITAHEKAEKKRKEEEAERKQKERVQAIKEAGMVFDGNFYVIGNAMSMDLTTVTKMKDSDFDALVAKIQLEKIRIDKEAEEDRLRKEQEEKEQKEREAKLKEEEEKQEAERKKLEDEKAELERERKELAEMKAQALFNARLSDLVNIGFVHHKDIDKVVYKNDISGSVTLTRGNILAVEPEDWNEQLGDWQQDVQELITKAKEVQDQRDKEERERKEKEEADRKKEEQERIEKQRIEERSNSLKKFLYIIIDGAFRFEPNPFQSPAIEFDSILNEDYEPFEADMEVAKGVYENFESERKAAQEAQRKAKLGDDEAINEYVTEVLAAVEKRPDLKIGTAQEKLNIFVDQVMAQANELLNNE